MARLFVSNMRACRLFRRFTGPLQLLLLLALAPLSAVRAIEPIVPRPPQAPPEPPPILKTGPGSVVKQDPPGDDPAILWDIGQPTDEEQLYLEYINRSRADPPAEGF